MKICILLRVGNSFFASIVYLLALSIIQYTHHVVWHIWNGRNVCKHFNIFRFTMFIATQKNLKFVKCIKISSILIWKQKDNLLQIQKKNILKLFLLYPHTLDNIHKAWIIHNICLRDESQGEHFKTLQHSTFFFYFCEEVDGSEEVGNGSITLVWVNYS